MRALRLSAALTLFAFWAGVASAQSPVASSTELSRIAAAAAPEVEFGRWQGTGYGGFLVPKNLDIADDGGVDVLVHFNGAMMTDAAYRASKTNAIVMSIAINEVVGSGGYARLFEDVGRLDRVLDALFAQVSKAHKKNVHLRRLGLVSWSAGMGAIGKILRTPKWAARIDSIVLLDSLHAGYHDKDGRPITKNPANPVMGLGDDAVETKSLEPLVQFARLAAQGKKTFVVSASAITPPDYASCSETARVLYKLAMGRAVEDADGVETSMAGRPMRLKFRGQKGNFHVFGWHGGSKRAHFDQLHLVGDMLREHVGHRWRELSQREHAEHRS